MNRAGITLLTLAAALVLGGLGFWLGRQQPPIAEPAAAGDVAARAPVVAAAGTVSRPAEPARSSATAAAPASPPAAPTAALPPPNTPVAAVYQQLADRARAGDARAACRLANDLSACRNLALLREQRDGIDRSLLSESSKPKPSDPRLKQLLNQQDQLAARVTESERQCGGLPAARIDEAFDWLKLAADQGHVPSMARFAQDPLIPMNRMVKDLDRLLLYRANAPRYALAALAAGNADIVPLLAEAYRAKSPSGGGYLSQVLPEDPVQSLAYLTLARRLNPVNPSGSGSDPLEMQRAELDTDQQARAQALADDLYQKYFAGRAVQARPTTQFDSSTWWCERDH